VESLSKSSITKSMLREIESLWIKAFPFIFNPTSLYSIEFCSLVLAASVFVVVTKYGIF